MTTTMLIILGAAFGIGLVWLRSRFAGFMAQKPADYAKLSPAIDIRDHLDGKILCEGMIYGPFGRVTSRFVAEMNATWDGDTGTMTEHFKYDSGATQDRIWTLSVGENGMITSAAPDIIGDSGGQQIGPVVKLNYRLKLAEDAGGHVLDVTDWMYLLENGTVMNRSQFRKFGIKVAELVATMRKI